MKKILFVCTSNIQRSPTAEKIFKNKYDVKSAGVDSYVNPLTKAMLKWADIVFVMEDEHKTKILNRFPKEYGKKVISLDVPDIFDYMDKKLIKLLKKKVKLYINS